MKRNKIGTFFGLLFLALVGTIIASPTPDAEAQVVVYGHYCCDQWGAVRCAIYPSAPVGVGCYCNGIPGSGWVC